MLWVSFFFGMNQCLLVQCESCMVYVLVWTHSLIEVVSITYSSFIVCVRNFTHTHTHIPSHTDEDLV